MNLQIVPLGNNILVDFKKQDIKNKNYPENSRFKTRNSFI